MAVTIKTLESYLGRPVTTALSDAPFKNWEFEKTFENDLDEPIIDYTFPHNGVELSCDRDGQVKAIFLYSDETRHFDEGVLDIPFSSTRRQVLERLGAPSKSGDAQIDPLLGEYGPWDRFGRSGYSIHVQY